MEYRVYLPKLRQSAERLEEIARKQRRTCDSLEETIRKLRRLSYMEPVITVLARRMRELEEELQKILRMAQSLRRIEQRYRDMENAILDGLELPPAGQHPNGAGPFRPGTPAWPPTIVFPTPPQPQPTDAHWMDEIYKYLIGKYIEKICQDFWEKRMWSMHKSPQEVMRDYLRKNNGFHGEGFNWDGFNGTDTNTIPPQAPQEQDLLQSLRDLSHSPLWVTPEGRDGSRWCCPVVHLSVAHAEPEEVVGNNVVAVRLASLPAADN